jgi:proteasome lid subunit RPN8/RPN11
MFEELRFQLEGANWCLEFSAAANSTMYTHAQTGCNSRESVGQLYTRDLTGETVEIELATWMKPKFASWGRVKFDTKKAFAERIALFEQGYHCIGIWHTHPEPYPSPSSEDRTLARDYAKSAQTQLDGIVFVIVGTLAPPDCYKVWVDDSKELLLARRIEMRSMPRAG